MPLKNGPFVWFDGKLVRWEEATIHVASHVLHYGSSVFEGVRAYETKNGTAIFRLHPHVKRLLNSCKIGRIDVPWTLDQLQDAIIETVANNGQTSCYIRPLIFRGMEVLGVDGRKSPTQVAIFTISWGRYLGPEAIEQGVDVGVSSWRRMAPGTGASLAKIGGQYVNSQFAKMEALENGYSEAIVLDTNGFVSEGSGENIFVIMDGVIFTTPVASSILAGVTRDSAMTLARDLGYEVREQAISRDMLYVADEIFFTGTAAEITPIRSVDRITIGKGSRGPVTKAIQDQFFGITTGELPDKYRWLTPVTVQETVSGD
jgi:branched-chain amino acid aminotransferase